MKKDILPPVEQSSHDSSSDPTPISVPLRELERVDSLLDSTDNAEIGNIMQLLLEQGAIVQPGTQVIESPFDDDMLYDVTHFYGVETRLPQGIARFTVRAWRRTFSDDYRARTIRERERLNLSAVSHEEFLREQGATGILVVSSWTDKVDGKPRKIEDTLGYVHPDGGNVALIRAGSGEVDANLPEALISPFVTPAKLSGEPITLEDAQFEGDITRKELQRDSGETRVKRALGRFGIGRRKT